MSLFVQKKGSHLAYFKYLKHCKHSKYFAYLKHLKHFKDFKYEYHVSGTCSWQTRSMFARARYSLGYTFKPQSRYFRESVDMLIRGLSFLVAGDNFMDQPAAGPARRFLWWWGGCSVSTLTRAVPGMQVCWQRPECQVGAFACVLRWCSKVHMGERGPNPCPRRREA